MGYQGHDPLNINKNALSKPLCHKNRWPYKDTTGLGFGIKNDLPRFGEEVYFSSDYDNDDDSPTLAIIQEGDGLPSTSLLWGKEPLFTYNDTEASTSRRNAHSESNVEDPNSGRIHKNISCLMHYNQSSDSGDYEWDTLSEASCEVGIDIIHAYMTQLNFIDESYVRSDGLDPYIAYTLP